MACEFAVILNRHDEAFADPASLALEQVHGLGECMTVYDETSELSQMNRAGGSVEVSDDLITVLRTAVSLFRDTDGLFDPTTGPLIELWRECRSENRIPTEEEIQSTLSQVGGQHIEIKERSVTLRSGIGINLGAIGKGYALDRAGTGMRESGADNFLLHGGRSSIVAVGSHNDLGGWPVGIGNPIFTNERLGIVLLENCALGTSGSNIQYFRHGGKRYGHILDPRTGWPASQIASVTILAPTAAEADALSTAFFVGGVEFARSYCDNHPKVSAILIPFPESGRRIKPVLVNMPADRITWSSEQVDLT